MAFLLCWLLLFGMAVDSQALMVSRNSDKSWALEVLEEDFKELISSDPPPHEEVARMARYICHLSDWAAMATIASRAPLTGFPFANVFSISDGPLDNSTGIPYLYLTSMELSVKDLRKDPRASLTMSLKQDEYCREHSYDAQDPRCAHIILTGEIQVIENNTEEAKFAQEALFSRHPVMADWPADHEWFFAKLAISQVAVLDYFGGAKYVPLPDYYAATPY